MVGKKRGPFVLNSCKKCKKGTESQRHDRSSSLARRSPRSRASSLVTIWKRPSLSSERNRTIPNELVTVHSPCPRLRRRIKAHHPELRPAREWYTIMKSPVALLVSNLNKSYTEADIRKIFSFYGIMNVRIHYNVRGRSTGKADIVFFHRKDALAIMRAIEKAPKDKEFGRLKAKLVPMRDMTWFNRTKYN